MLEDAHGRCPTKDSRNPFTCGLSGRTYTAAEVAERVEQLAKGLAEEFGWHPNQGREWDKVIGIFALNTVRYPLRYDMGMMLMFSRWIPCHWHTPCPDCLA